MAKSKNFDREIYNISKSGEFSRDFGLAGQIQRASVSIMSNIAEGYERNNPGDYHRFLQFAKASCGEVRSQLYVALDIGYISKEDFSKLRDKAVEISRIIAGIMKTVNKQRN